MPNAYAKKEEACLAPFLLACSFRHVVVTCACCRPRPRVTRARTNTFAGRRTREAQIKAPSELAELAVERGLDCLPRPTAAFESGFCCCSGGVTLHSHACPSAPRQRQMRIPRPTDLRRLPPASRDARLSPRDQDGRHLQPCKRPASTGLMPESPLSIASGARSQNALCLRAHK